MICQQICVMLLKTACCCSLFRCCQSCWGARFCLLFVLGGAIGGKPIFVFIAGYLLTLNGNASEQVQQLSHNCEVEGEWIQYQWVSSQIGYTQRNSSPYISAEFYCTTACFLLAAIGNLNKSQSLSIQGMTRVKDRYVFHFAG